MQPTSRMLLAASALAALLAPAIQAELSAAHLQQSGATPKARALSFNTNPAHILPTDSGFGAGMWIAPTDTAAGFASAQLYDAAGRVRYAMRANLLPASASPAGEDEQGGFLGTLFQVDSNGAKTAIAGVSGKWIRHASGMGEFGLDIVVETGDRNQPSVGVGQIDGSLLPEGMVPSPGMEPVDDEPATQGYLCLQWALQRP